MERVYSHMESGKVMKWGGFDSGNEWEVDMAGMESMMGSHACKVHAREE